MEKARDIIAKRLRFLRKEKGISLAELSRQTGYSTKTLSAWENAKSSMRSNQIIVLTNFYEVSVDFLLGLDEENPQV